MNDTTKKEINIIDTVLVFIILIIVSLFLYVSIPSNYISELLNNGISMSNNSYGAFGIILGIVGYIAYWSIQNIVQMSRSDILSWGMMFASLIICGTLLYFYITHNPHENVQILPFLIWSSMVILGNLFGVVNNED